MCVLFSASFGITVCTLSSVRPLVPSFCCVREQMLNCVCVCLCLCVPLFAPEKESESERVLIKIVFFNVVLYCIHNMYGLN